MKKALLLFVFALATATGYAKEGMCDFIHYVDGIYYQYIDGAAWVSRKAHYGYQDEIIWDYNCYAGQIVIPQKVAGYTVVGILDAAFDRSVDLTSVTIPSTINTIGGYAFYHTEGLTSITIPATVNSLGEYCFTGSGLKKITFEDGDKPLTLDKGSSAYNGDGMFAFSNVPDLEEVYLGRVIETKWEPFYANRTLKQVTFGSTVKEIPQAWFQHDTALQTVKATTSLKSIGKDSFKNCEALTVFKADGLKEIGEDAFSQCTSLKAITLAGTLKTIGPGVFYGTTALTELTIPASVTSIGEGAFKYSGLKKLTFADGDQPLQMGKGGTGNESMFSYQKVGNLEEVYIGRNIQLTGGDGDLFYSLRGLKKVTFGDVCTEVPDGWFSQCTGLESVTLGKNITRIGNRAFKNCEVMNSLTCYNIKTIGDEAFHSCKSIVKWDFVNCQLETIGEDAFYWNTSLKIVGLPATLKSIASDGFYSCEALEEITCLAPVPPTCGNKNVFRYLDTSKCKLLVPEGSIDAYKAADVWKDFFNIEAGIKGILSDNNNEWFDLNGRRLSAPQKGIRIIRQNGHVQKVVVR